MLKKPKIFKNVFNNISVLKKLTLSKERVNYIHCYFLTNCIVLFFYVPGKIEAENVPNEGDKTIFDKKQDKPETEAKKDEASEVLKDASNK